jgi:hypothetical protein
MAVSVIGAGSLAECMVVKYAHSLGPDGKVFTDEASRATGIAEDVIGKTLELMAERGTAVYLGPDEYVVTEA